ncbi:MAG: tRNA adenosine(34) deaminase TadA [Acidobacteria bacterium]|nr:tRNA adenosine(34) deaminase TadA [Acidobacteriota bacterium]
MRLALEAAETAYSLDEVPIGAVLVFEEKIIAVGYNRTRLDIDPTSHAEIITIREASKKLNNYRLIDTTLYTTIEPCAMCAGAMIWARVARLVYGAKDLRAGAVDSVFQICNNTSLNHRISVTSGVLEEDCRAVMQKFFRARR